MNHLSSKIIQWSLFSIIMTIIFYLIAKSRKKDLVNNSSNTLSLPLYVLIIGLVDFIFFMAIAVLSNVFSNGTESIGTTVIFLAFSLLGLLLIYFYYIEKYSFTNKEIFYKKFTGKKVIIDISTIKSVKYQASMQWIVIKFNSSNKSYFATMLKGIRPFSDMILTNVEIGKIDSKTQEILKRIKNGEVV